MKNPLTLLALMVLTACGVEDQERLPRQTMNGVHLVIVKPSYGADSGRYQRIYFSNEKAPIRQLVLRTTYCFDQEGDSAAGYGLGKIENVKAGAGGMVTTKAVGIPAAALHTIVSIDTVW